MKHVTKMCTKVARANELAFVFIVLVFLSRLSTY